MKTYLTRHTLRSRARRVLQVICARLFDAIDTAFAIALGLAMCGVLLSALGAL